MHTFFVNTAKNLLDAADGNVERYLFANLKNSNKLLFYNTGLEKLSVCAREICDVIDKDEAVGTDFNVIVYVDIDNSAADAADAYVYENIYLMAVNENFALALYRRGKTAQNIQVIFGEHFSRNDQLEKEHPDGNKLWTALGFPPVNGIEELITEIRKGTCERMTVNDCLSTGFIKLLKAEESRSLIGNDSDFYQEIVVRFIDALAKKIESQVETNLTKELSTAFEVIGKIRRRRYTRQELAFITLFAANSDEHMESRSAYQLYLYVYYCAANEVILQAVPEVDWAKFAHIIASRQLVFKKECEHMQDIVSEFDFLNTSGIGGEDVKAGMKIDLFPIAHAAPELTQNSKKLRYFLQVKRLKRLQEELLADVAEKNERNETLINDFIVQIRENYINGKKDAMKQKRKNFREKKDGTKSIDSADLTFERAERFMVETEGYIAGQEYLQAENINFGERIKEARAKTDYWFDCIKRHWWFAIVFVAVWGVFFAAPYLRIQYSDLDHYDYGMLIFLVTLGIIAVVFWVAHFCFRHTYKRMIKKEIRGTVNAFNRAQAAKEKNAEIFKSRLTYYYPRSEILRSYYEDVLQYMEDEKELSLLKDYHKRYLSGFAEEYVNGLIYNLDIRNLVSNVEEPDSNTFVYYLNSDTVRRSAPELVDLYYIMTQDTVNQVLTGEDLL
jgi:hypothetical protein